MHHPVTIESLLEAFAPEEEAPLTPEEEEAVRLYEANFNHFLRDYWKLLTLGFIFMVIAVCALFIAQPFGDPGSWDYQSLKHLW